MKFFSKQLTKKKKQKTRNWILTISVVLSLIIFGCLTGMVIGKDNIRKILKKIDNFTEIFCQKNIVMLGNSLTEAGEWAILLQRRDVSNKGIGGHTTEDFINRIDRVLRLQPEICFIEGGINDLSRGIITEIIVRNLEIIVDTLQNNHTKPVLTTVSYVTEAYDRIKPLNDSVKALNELIFKLAERKNVPVLDLNGILSEGEFLKADYAHPDGLHFSDKAYVVWRDAVIELLNQESHVLQLKKQNQTAY